MKYTLYIFLWILLGCAYSDDDVYVLECNGTSGDANICMQVSEGPYYADGIMTVGIKIRIPEEVKPENRIVKLSTTAGIFTRNRMTSYDVIMNESGTDSVTVQLGFQDGDHEIIATLTNGNRSAKYVERIHLKTAEEPEIGFFLDQENLPANGLNRTQLNIQTPKGLFPLNTVVNVFIAQNGGRFDHSSASIQNGLNKAELNLDLEGHATVDLIGSARPGEYSVFMEIEDRKSFEEQTVLKLIPVSSEEVIQVTLAQLNPIPVLADRNQIFQLDVQINHIEHIDKRVNFSVDAKIAKFNPSSASMDFATDQNGKASLLFKTTCEAGEGIVTFEVDKFRVLYRMPIQIALPERVRFQSPGDNLIQLGEGRKSLTIEHSRMEPGSKTTCGTRINIDTRLIRTEPTFKPYESLTSDMTDEMTFNYVLPIGVTVNDEIAIRCCVDGTNICDTLSLIVVP